MDSVHEGGGGDQTKKRGVIGASQTGRVNGHDCLSEPMKKSA